MTWTTNQGHTQAKRGKAFRIVKQLPDGESLPPKTLNLCRCCYKPISNDHRVHYCGLTCRHQHKRLGGTP